MVDFASIGNWTSGAMGGLAIIAGWIVVGSLVIFLVFYIIREKKYNWKVRIYEKDASGKLIEMAQDKGGIFIERKTQNRLFLLKHTKFGLTPDRIPYIHNNKGIKTVYLLKKGLKNYQYLVPTINETEGRMIFNLQDEDVAWGINAYQKYKLPSKNDLLKQILPVIGIAIFAIVVLGGIYMILQKVSVIQSIAEGLQETAKLLKEANIGTTIVP